jgi:hypothetical protein
MGIVDGGEGYPLERQSFGIYSVSAINRSTNLPYGMAAIVGDCSVNLEASSVDNRGGSSLFPRATEITEIDSNATFNLRSWPDWVYTVFFGATVSTTAASATSGTVGTIANEKGTSVVATTGIATATLKSGEAANLKYNYYWVVAADPTTVDVYAASNFQFKRGTDLFFDSDVLKITTSPLTIVQSAAVEIPGTGIELTGDSGIIAMTAGDVAFFDVVPPHNGVSDIDIGSAGIVFPEHELILFGKQRASGELFSIRCYKAQAVSGGSIPMTQADFASTDITCKLLLDTTRDKIATVKYADGIL